MLFLKKFLSIIEICTNIFSCHLLKFPVTGQPGKNILLLESQETQRLQSEKTSRLILPRYKNNAADTFIDRTHTYYQDRFMTKNVGVYYNKKYQPTLRVQKTDTSWTIQLQYSVNHCNIILGNAAFNQQNHNYLPRLKNLLSKTSNEYCLGIYAFTNQEWDTMEMKFDDISYYVDTEEKSIHHGGNPIKIKDLVILASNQDADIDFTDYYLNDDIINLVLSDIVQPSVKNALYLSTHYYEVLKRYMSSSDLSEREKLDLLRWGVRIGQNAAKILNMPSSTAILHINGNHWYSFFFFGGLVHI